MLIYTLRIINTDQGCYNWQLGGGRTPPFFRKKSWQVLDFLLAGFGKSEKLAGFRFLGFQSWQVFDFLLVGLGNLKSWQVLGF